MTGEIVKQLKQESVAITDNLGVTITKVMYKQGKGENGEWTCYEIWLECAEQKTLVHKIFRPKLTAISKAEFANTLKEFIDCLEGEGTWNKIPRFSSWNEFDTYIIDTLSKYIDKKVFVKTLAVKDYFDPSRMTAALATKNFIAKDISLAYTNLEKNQVQDYYIELKKHINRHFK